MDRNTRNAAIAAFVLIAVFACLAYVMPAIMLWLGERSPIAAGVAVAAFILTPFVVLWLRSRSQKRRGG